MTPEDRAAAHARLLGNSFTLWLELAADCQPDLLREALSKVFNLAAVEDMARRSMLVVSEAQQAALEVRHLLAAIGKDIEGLEQRLDAINHELTQMEPARRK